MPNAKELLLSAERLKNMLVARARGTVGDDDEYHRLRATLVEVEPVRETLPRFVQTCHSLAEFWGFIQPKFSTYAERTSYVREQFEPLFGLLEPTAHGSGAFPDSSTQIAIKRATMKPVASAANAPPGSDVSSRQSNVFVIHGRNLRARDEMGTFLRACGLKPINFADLRAAMGGTPTIDRIVEEGMARAQGVVAMFTADEYAALRPDFRTAREQPGSEIVERWQARPNVIFEAGMAFGRDRNRVVFVLFGDAKLFTDVAGVHVLRPSNDPTGDRAVLRETLRKSMGCDVEDSTAWMTSGDFESCAVPFAPHPVDPFANQIAPSNAHVTEGDARIRLGCWLDRLDSRKSGQALEFSVIAAHAGVSFEQARTLLNAVVESSADGWKVASQGDSVVVLRWTPVF